MKTNGLNGRSTNFYLIWLKYEKDMIKNHQKIGKSRILLEHTVTASALSCTKTISQSVMEPLGHQPESTYYN